LKNKRSELVEKFHLEGFPDDRIISVAQKEFAADQRLREAKEAVDQRFSDRGSQGAGASRGVCSIDQLGGRAGLTQTINRTSIPPRPDQVGSEELLARSPVITKVGSAENGAEHRPSPSALYLRWPLRQCAEALSRKAQFSLPPDIYRRQVALSALT
jgi:hypothetical protein